jgi:hypothetical protein
MDIKDIAPVIALVGSLMIPVIVILTRHQQKMTLLIRQDALNAQNSSGDLQSIQYDVQQLKSMVATLAMSVDTLKDEVRSTNSIQDRVKIQG